MMKSNRAKVWFILFLLNLLWCGNGEREIVKDEASYLSVAEDVLSQFSTLVDIIAPRVMETLGYCINNVYKDWAEAFGFEKNITFLANCLEKTKGDMPQRLCSSAEIMLYFTSFVQSGSERSIYVQPNQNCNLTSWLPGCEPGWACKIGDAEEVGQVADLKSYTIVPIRIEACQPCCEGFFCPDGLTCMIPCPLGSYCPIAGLNQASGFCDPYRYRLPPGQPNHTCGGANIWADIKRSREIFCSAGSYCPTAIEEKPCGSGYYCRTGSIYQTRCLRMTDCDPESENQNSTAYGILLLGGLTILLVIIYNCSDQVLAMRERRQARKRETARESAQERERWKSAKDVAKGLQTTFSRTFSRRKSVKQQTEQQVSKDQGTKSSKAKEPGDLMKRLREIENNPEGYSLDIGDHSNKSPKKKKNMKPRHLHTPSEIFSYAYGQIEKEKALQEMNKDLTFSGIISMATHGIEIRNRPTIEVEFKDLTLTLKGTKRHLLHCVTGKISPGRVSAVMGPSGAGKTTFLSALAGKATGCTVDGKILINGKAESIYSYKKIIGFVPQDDVVHGNLTVEENLWFSARCRLSASLPKAEKVLVVERVIESLGLQAVRDSLVGTVEKRGISGGQRKRVNVGLEMVMEPSLLILDEPTSGLDSSTSQLLLRALRREALEGVNICMVVHQPSYTLFKMFDDFILLAKGGLIVYLGSAKEVEEYFAGMGITVPDRVNPPDYFIDILEGIEKPTSSSDFDYKELPIRWMLHNRYPVPPNLQKVLEVGLKKKKGASESRENPSCAVEGKEDQDYSNDPSGSSTTASANVDSDDRQSSFLGDIWLDMKCFIQLKCDQVQHNILTSNDLSRRVTPGVFQQYRYFLGRVGKQRLRDAGIQAVDYIILLLAGACLGTLAKVSDETFGAAGYTYTIIAVSLLSKIAALRSFSQDKLHYWRESGSGMSSLAYFLAKDTVDHFNTIIKPLVYLSMFYFFNNPRSSFLENYIILLCLVYCVTGIAYIFAIFSEAGPAQLWSVLLPVVLTLIATQDKGGEGFIKNAENFCYPKWALEAFVVANAQRYAGVWLITRCGALFKSGYSVHDMGLCLAVLIVTGAISRIVAFNIMIFKKK